MTDHNFSKFICHKCGGRELVITHVWNTQAGVNGECWQERGPLKNNHHWQYEFKEKMGANAGDKVQRGDLGEFVLDTSASGPEEYQSYEFESSREDDDFFINCGNSDREIEFGWSQPDRRGLILPVDFSDFDPVESWPDPKYVDVWRHRGWPRAEVIRPWSRPDQNSPAPI